MALACSIGQFTYFASCGQGCSSRNLANRTSCALLYVRPLSGRRQDEKAKYSAARDQFWNLSKQPFPGFEHAFFKTRAGKKLHYVTNRSRSAQGGQTQSGNGNLFVLLHGFPDTYAMWRYMLKDPAIPHSTARIVCLDLPNFGGSDTFDPPDTTVLEAIAEFVLAIREEHENDAGVGEKDFSTVLVADDWGCAIGFRLAAEAPQLADRFVLMNGPHVSRCV